MLTKDNLGHYLDIKKIGAEIITYLKEKDVGVRLFLTAYSQAEEREFDSVKEEFLFELSFIWFNEAYKKLPAVYSQAVDDVWVYLKINTDFLKPKALSTEEFSTMKKQIKHYQQNYRAIEAKAYKHPDIKKEWAKINTQDETNLMTEFAKYVLEVGYHKNVSPADFLNYFIYTNGELVDNLAAKVKGLNTLQKL